MKLYYLQDDRFSTLNPIHAMVQNYFLGKRYSAFKYQVRILYHDTIPIYR